MPWTISRSSKVRKGSSQPSICQAVSSYFIVMIYVNTHTHMQNHLIFWFLVPELNTELSTWEACAITVLHAWTLWCYLCISYYFLIKKIFTEGTMIYKVIQDKVSGVIIRHWSHHQCQLPCSAPRSTPAPPCLLLSMFSHTTGALRPCMQRWDSSQGRGHSCSEASPVYILSLWPLKLFKIIYKVPWAHG